MRKSNKNASCQEIKSSPSIHSIQFPILGWISFSEGWEGKGGIGGQFPTGKSEEALACFCGGIYPSIHPFLFILLPLKVRPSIHLAILNNKPILVKMAMLSNIRNCCIQTSLLSKKVTFLWTNYKILIKLS